jgi:hypothetical protein
MNVISWIPISCLFGIFLYLGVTAMHGNEIWERITLIFILQHKERPQITVVTKVSKWSVVVAIYMYTSYIGWYDIWYISICFMGVLFSTFNCIICPIPIVYIVRRLFNENDLSYLDPVTETDTDYITNLIDYCSQT